MVPTPSIGPCTTVPVGALAPYELVWTVTSPVGGFDLSLVTAAVFAVRRGDGSLDSWPATIGTQSSGSVTITRVFQAGDVPNVDGNIVVAPELTTPAGVIYALPGKLIVRARF